MKKMIAVILLALFLGAPLVRAQEPEWKNEINLSWGFAPVQDFAMGFGSVFVIIFSLGSVSFENAFSTGAVNVEYYRTLNDTFAVGGIFTGLVGGADEMTKQSGTYVKTGDLRYLSLTLMPSVKAYWFRHDRCSMYSKLALGGGIFSSGDSSSLDIPDFLPSAQVSPVAIELGSIRDRGFLELGIGMQGFLTAGYRHTF